MIISSLRLVLFCILLTVIQFAINNFTIFYVDIFAILLVAILMRGNVAWAQLISLSIYADLVGHWYLGSHLLAITIVSIVSPKFVNFYRMCSFFQRNIILSMFYLVMTAIIFIVELATGKVFTSKLSLVLELLVILPVIQVLLNNFIFKRPTEYLFND